MAEKQQHHNQATKNAERAEALLEGEVYDWAVVTFFFSAVHYVEAYLASYNIHSNGNSDRIASIQKHLPGIFSEYRILETLSNELAIELVAPNPAEIDAAEKSFNILRDYIEAQI